MIAGALTLTALAGCKTDSATKMSDTRDADMDVMTMSGVDVDSSLASLCGVDNNKVFFKFDSAQITPEAKERLDGIATCVLTGAAAGRHIIVVGRTDPKGTDDYNTQLGMSRAESVANYLKGQGVVNSRVETRSRGSEDASPDSWGWSYDRRVSILLAP
ncbi:MAG TPA: OmpA family protein [Myxococcota bacterium]